MTIDASTVATLPSQAAPPLAPAPLISPIEKIERENNWQEAYGLRVRQLIEKNKRYPLMARRAGMEGVVDLAFKIAPNGSLIEVVVNRSSGFPILDQAAVHAVQGIGDFPPWPGHPSDPGLELTIPMAFRLTRR